MEEVVKLAKTIGKTIVLLLLVVIMVLLALLWFDYLGVIQAKSVFAPVYNLLGLQTQTSESITTTGDLVSINLDDERFAKRLEQLDLRRQELDLRESRISQQETQNAQITEELEERRISQEEREKTFNNMQKKYDDRDVNITFNASNLNSMRPENAVEILLAMEDQDMIDVLRKADELGGAQSQVSYWLSLMPADRVAELVRKMNSKPTSLE